jgi:hypothetical protein
MKSWQIVRMAAGTMVLLSLALGVAASPLFVSAWWLGLAVFVGANLLQSAVTGWCPLEIMLRRFGVRSGC